MSQTTNRPAPSTTAVAQEHAGDVKDTAKQATGQVAGTAKDEAANVISEAKQQTRDLLDQSREELRSQASTQQDRLAGGLRSLADELHSMATSSQQQGLASDLARQAADHASTAAGWLQNREPGDVLQEVRMFAQRRPGAFLGLALTAGVLVGRVGRGLKDDSSSNGSAPSSSSRSSSPAPYGSSTGVPQHRASEGSGL
jgi:hypothetical protein